jgi:hypothetical protein
VLRILRETLPQLSWPTRRRWRFAHGASILSPLSSPEESTELDLTRATLRGRPPSCKNRIFEPSLGLDTPLTMPLKKPQFLCRTRPRGERSSPWMLLPKLVQVS